MTTPSDPYEFDAVLDESITLPKQLGSKKKKVDAAKVEQAAAAGKVQGFVRRTASSKRKPGPKRTEPQGKVSLTGPQRVIERLQARCDAMGGIPYWQAIEIMLDETGQTEGQG